MGHRTHWARWAPLVASLVLLVGLAGFGFSLIRSSTAAAETALGEGAIEKQRTVAALTDQYLRLAAKEAADFAAGRPLVLASGDPDDVATLHQLVDDKAGFFGHGAMLADLAGHPLNAVGDLPPADDPGYLPLRRALGRQEPGVSSLMWAQDVPVVAIGVPVMRDGSPAAVLLAFFRADASMLQRYSEKLGQGTDGVGMVVDGTGTIVAARHADLVGTSLQASPALESSGAAGHAEVDRDGAESR